MDRYVKLSTGYYLDAAVIRAGDDAELLFLRAMAYAGGSATRGHVPTAVPPRLCPTRTRQRVAALVREDLWVVMPGGWQIRSWEHWQDRLDLVEDRRRRDRERKARVRGLSADKSADVRATEKEEEVEAAAAAPETAAAALDPRLEILRGRLEAVRLFVRWDRLDATQVDEIAALAERHGDASLVTAAQRSYRPDSPPQFAQAWLAGWRALPDPARGRLQLVAAYCHTHHQAEPCTGCAADRKAQGGHP